MVWCFFSTEETLVVPFFLLLRLDVEKYDCDQKQQQRNEDRLERRLNRNTEVELKTFGFVEHCEQRNHR